MILALLGQALVGQQYCRETPEGPNYTERHDLGGPWLARKCLDDAVYVTYLALLDLLVGVPLTPWAPYS